MSTYGDATRTLPFFTIRIEDHYSDENGYGKSRDIYIDTLVGSFQINTYFRVRSLFRTVRDPKTRKYWRYYLPVSYTKPELQMNFTDNAESIRDTIRFDKERQAKKLAFKKLPAQKRLDYLERRKVESIQEAREVYVRILRDVKRPKDADIVEAGGYVDGVDETAIRQMADSHYETEAKFLTSPFEPKPARK